MAKTFKTRDEELAYLKQVKAELDAATTKQEVAALWNRHYLTIGHRKLGRLLLGQSPEQAMRMGRGGREE
jgi:hypothetical protein